ncbi:MAG: uroporphyrinogen-III synthase, partial [Solirubrobacterales bacterium]|nr:uroporphyrinogen-III synthase [Solirubrobacterales bacterium]
VAFVTGHENPDKPETQIDWPALAAFPGTLVFYMGVRSLGQIAEALISGGRPGEQPAAVIERGTFPAQREVVGTLETIAQIAEEAEIKAPAITVIGDVAALGEEIGWRDRAQPLAGKTIAVTRARAQASALAARLSALGAEVVEAPAIKIEPLNPKLPDLASYDLLCLTSPNGVEQLFAALSDARDLAGLTIAAIGPGTARALLAHGIKADVVPDRSVAEALVEALVDVPIERALIARAEEARDVLPDALRARGAEVDLLALYRTVAEPLDDAARAAALGADYATFTSASSARFFHEAAGTLDGPRLISIGPVTSDQLRELGYEPAAEASDHTPDGLVAALIADSTTR